MMDKYGLLSRGNQWRSLRNEEFQEQEVWDIFAERECYGSKVAKPKDFSSFSSSSLSSSLARSIPSASRMIPRPTIKNNFSDITSQEPRVIQQSAPVNIPDWSEIYGRRKKVTKRLSWLDVDDDDDDASGVMHNNGDYSDDEEENEDDDDDFGMKLPPHEVIARRFARTQISSFSVFEGVGRTLKGRDLSKVRNAVLTKTGFLE
ncbi:Senescence regulator S40 [Dillenia turbinata]|uniref:Senescence regulator S40 n=1 Tax=Dillenia turbinata TaxID=194707 RepID=A0AAN8VG75_9MAGN